jgi:hypothetical protein
VTVALASTFFLGTFYRSATLYHPQRRAILHLKNQRKKIKDTKAHRRLQQQQQQQQQHRDNHRLLTSSGSQTTTTAAATTRHHHQQQGATPGSEPASATSAGSGGTFKGQSHVVGTAGGGGGLADTRPPFLDFSALRSTTFRILLFATATSSLGLNTPLIYLVLTFSNPNLSRV